MKKIFVVAAIMSALALTACKLDLREMPGGKPAGQTQQTQ